MSAQDLSHFSLLELFRMEADTQLRALASGLLVLEGDPSSADQLGLCMRAAHSLKGAARIINLDVAVRVAHALEDCLVAAQRGTISLGRDAIDALLSVTDLLARIAKTEEGELDRWNSQDPEVDNCLSTLSGLLARGQQRPLPADERSSPIDSRAAGRDSTPAGKSQAPPVPVSTSDEMDSVLRVTAENLNRLLNLAGESLVESRWMKPFRESLLRLKHMQHESGNLLDSLCETLSNTEGTRNSEHVQTMLAEARRSSLECQEFLRQRLGELEMFDRRSISLSHRLYDEALACRMRPIADLIQGFPRMVRDLARSLDKQVKLEIVGEGTQVDRDILTELEAPLGHLIRNAIDHGLEPPGERIAAGKPADGVLRVEARHTAGALHIVVSDDGRGVDLERIREAVVARNLIDPKAAEVLSEAELLEFLFLPGFTMKSTVTEISGRGVGLDVVRDMLKRVRGTVRVSSQPGMGTRFQLQLPVSLSVVRTLVAEIAGEPYAFPLAHITRMFKLPKDRIEQLEGRQHFNLDGRMTSLVTAHQIFGVDQPPLDGDELSIIILDDQGCSCGLVVDHFRGERELVVQPLDPHLGKIKDIAAGALLDDGSPVLIVDVEDLIRSMEKLASGDRLNRVSHDTAAAGEQKARKRVLVVDDSLTVRELERKLLSNHGYEVEVAVDGMDGWNAVRSGHFNLVVTDIDMPRMDGIELVTLINKDANLKSIPVMVVSYKDRDEDRRRGLEAGAAYYLTKGSFHDDTLLQAVVDLIGESNL